MPDLITYYEDDRAVLEQIDKKDSLRKKVIAWMDPKTREDLDILVTESDLVESGIPEAIEVAAILRAQKEEAEQSRATNEESLMSNHRPIKMPRCIDRKKAVELISNASCGD